MINESNLQLGKVRSVIRELFEYGKRRKSQIGEDKVFDFSLGNPSVPTPQIVSDELENIIKTCDPVSLHGYTSAQGDATVRRAIADDLNARYNAGLSCDNIYMTCGAAASLTITLNALLNDGDEVITFAPYFPEYKVFINHARGKLVAVKGEEKTFQIDENNLKKALTDKTKAVIINSPNNPSGVVYTEKSIQTLASVLKEHEKKTGNSIYLISDEPYRELVYGDVKVPFVMNYYDNSIVCYSFSKSLSLPGERIGYIAVSEKMSNAGDVYCAVMGSGRALGYVCAPNLFQQLVKRVVGKTADVGVYEQNRDLLCSALEEYGYEIIKPDGAFYLFVKTPTEDADEFMERAKKYDILVVSSNSFGVGGYVRISYCVSTEMIKSSLPSFKALFDSYK